MVGRLVIERGQAPASDEALEFLRGFLQAELGDEHTVEIGSWRGVRELRESQQIVPVVELFLDGIAATAAVVSAVAVGVRTWRRQPKVPPRKLSRTQLWTFDKDGRALRAWIEETEETEETEEA